MKVRFYFSALCALVVLSAFSTMKAQSPDQQFGIGVNLVAVSGTNSAASGATFAYAINPGLHIGTGFGLAVRSANGVSSNVLVFAPYVKGLFKGSKDFVPFIMGQFGITSGSSGGNSSTNTGLNVLGGAEYFASKNLGIYGSLSVLELGFDPSITTFGIGASANIGIEWFM
jgi:hypothetical protein